MCVFAGPDAVYELVNPKYQEILKGRELLGRSFYDALPELRGSEIAHAIKQVYETGVTKEFRDLLVPIAETENGPTT
ncbi:MAG: hypothetical protein EOP03_00040, partial [Proteobacteria bacterium]